MRDRASLVSTHAAKFNAGLEQLAIARIHLRAGRFGDVVAALMPRQPRTPAELRVIGKQRA